MTAYQHTSKASKNNAFCWQTGRPSCMWSLAEESRAKALAKELEEIGAAAFKKKATAHKPLASVTFMAESVGKTVAASRRDKAAQADFAARRAA